MYFYTFSDDVGHRISVIRWDQSDPSILKIPNKFLDSGSCRWLLGRSCLIQDGKVVIFFLNGEQPKESTQKANQQKACDKCEFSRISGFQVNTHKPISFQ